jgi:predicted metalloendopeptidase
MGETRRRKKNQSALCRIPIPAIASKSSYEDDPSIGHDFYKWMNDDWEKTVNMPGFENDFGISEEVERCILKTTNDILKDLRKKPGMFKDLADSCLNPSVQENSLDFLKGILEAIQDIKTSDDVFIHFAELCKRGYPSIFKIKTYTDPQKIVRLFIDSNCPGLHYSYYSNDEVIGHYKNLMKEMEKRFNIPGLLRIYNIERTLAINNENLWTEVNTKTKGSGLGRKFPKIPWRLVFETLGIKDWSQQTFYYASAPWFRYIGKCVTSVPVDYWKIYLSQCYIMNSLQFLPPPYEDLKFEFFDRILNGQKIKLPRNELLVKIIYDFLQDDFSKLFWERAGNADLVEEICEFAKSIVDAAKDRIETVDWLQYKTRLAAMKKISHMRIETVRPREWAPHIPLTLDSKNLLKNAFLLGEHYLQSMLIRVGHKYRFWEEGIYRVNAYYFNENNEIMVPYGSCIEPLYSRKESAAWNYGSLGAIIGHEICHGFDDYGKEFNECGEKKRWWTKKDSLVYLHKSKGLIRLFDHQKIGDKHVSGKKTLSENIADLGGLGISLQALKDILHKNGISDPEKIKAEYKKFFAAYAVSWRTKYREEKLEASIDTDPHAPAYLRVNLVVSQFDEWYAAFDVPKDAPMFVEPANRIRIF